MKEPYVAQVNTKNERKRSIQLFVSKMIPVTKYLEVFTCSSCLLQQLSCTRQL